MYTSYQPPWNLMKFISCRASSVRFRSAAWEIVGFEAKETNDDYSAIWVGRCIPNFYREIGTLIHLGPWNKAIGFFGTFSY